VFIELIGLLVDSSLIIGDLYPVQGKRLKVKGQRTQEKGIKVRGSGVQRFMFLFFRLIGSGT
jgi:hypothetical protein